MHAYANGDKTKIRLIYGIVTEKCVVVALTTGGTQVDSDNEHIRQTTPSSCK
jgi:hypothetical protein